MQISLGHGAIWNVAVPSCVSRRPASSSTPAFLCSCSAPLFQLLGFFFFLCQHRPLCSELSVPSPHSEPAPVFFSVVEAFMQHLFHTTPSLNANRSHSSGKHLGVTLPFPSEHPLSERERSHFGGHWTVAARSSVPATPDCCSAHEESPGSVYRRAQ